MGEYLCVNIREYLQAGKMGEAGLKWIISQFSCPANMGVERFLKNSAVEFTKKHQSVTYLVFYMGVNNVIFVGYFSVAIKPLKVKGINISNTLRKRLQRISTVEEEQTYTMAAYLIAQLGKNYTNRADQNIQGGELLDLAWSVIRKVQYLVGGIVVFLEAENHEKLLAFYEKENGFKRFDIRVRSDHGEKGELVQLLKVV